MKMKLTKQHIKEIQYQDIISIFDIFADEDWAILLDSATHSLPNEYNRYSYIGLRPYQTLVLNNHVFRINDAMSDEDPFQYLKKLLKLNQMEINVENMPPLCAGLMGYFSYDLLSYIEASIPKSQQNDLNVDDFAIGVYDTIIAWDHHLKKSWIICTGQSVPEKEMSAYIEKQLDVMHQKIENKARYEKSENSSSCVENFESSLSKNEYLDAVEKTRNYILNGDIFEANITQRFECPMPDLLSPYQLYKRIRKISPNPFAAFLNFPNCKIASASPERFLKLNNDHVETRPIKGTMPRGKTPEEDQKIANELLNSEKDKSENIMIVDLMRNDLSRVCRDDSVQVTKLCGLETFRSVHHLVSVIEGKLKQNHDQIDLLLATFPGGSITGAPKIRAMQIIYEIETIARGVYCGSIGFIGFNKTLDLSIAIRTYICKDNKITFHAGGAVVLDSDPLAEYEESLLKAKPFKKALIGPE